MPDAQLEIKRRNLPHWIIDGSMYFVTFRVLHGALTDIERAIMRDHVRSGDGRYYLLAASVIMPDHVHLLIRPAPSVELSRIMKGIKGVSARKISTARGVSGSLWQDESWDRIVRDDKEFQEKLQYMANNPVKAGLVREMEAYPFWYCHAECL